jgi:hypothetical protein
LDTYNKIAPIFDANTRNKVERLYKNYKLKKIGFQIGEMAIKLKELDN